MSCLQEMSGPVVDGNNEVTGHIISTTIGGKNGEPKQVYCTMLNLWLSDKLMFLALPCYIFYFINFCCDVWCRPSVTWQNVLWGLDRLELFFRYASYTDLNRILRVLMFRNLSLMVVYTLGKVPGNRRNSCYKKSSSRQEIQESWIAVDAHNESSKCCWS